MFLRHHLPPSSSSLLLLPPPPPQGLSSFALIYSFSQCRWTVGKTTFISLSLESMFYSLISTSTRSGSLLLQPSFQSPSVLPRGPFITLLPPEDAKADRLVLRFSAGRRILTYAIAKHWGPASMCRSRVRQAAWRAFLHWIVTFDRLYVGTVQMYVTATDKSRHSCRMYMLITMTFNITYVRTFISF